MIVVLYSKMFVGSSIQTPPSYFDFFGIAKLSQVEGEAHPANHPPQKKVRPSSSLIVSWVLSELVLGR